MTDCKFKVGETYKTRDGRNARVVAFVPDAKYADERMVAVVNGQIFTYCEDGASSLDGEGVLDLLPNKRTVWVNFYDGPYAYYYDSEAAADDAAKTILSPRRLGNRAHPVEINE